MELAQLQSQADALLAEIHLAVLSSPAEAEAFRLRFLGTKNVLKDLMALLPQLPPAERGGLGKLVNTVKQAAEIKFEEAKERIAAASEKNDRPHDLSRRGFPYDLGARHPIAIMLKRIVDIFAEIGFTVEDGPEIEDDWHNFGALNMPEDHPARDMQDTYYLAGDNSRVLRTHTSSVQVRVMNSQKPPIRAIFPGRVYRNETISARSHCQFHQVEGLYIDKNVSFADLRQTLLYFARRMYGENTGIRLRPSYFPFTEPSAEMDISCFFCGGSGCNICKQSGWVEILGCGMVDPAVLENCGIDPNVYSGFAFGMGIERQAMSLTRINDIRLLFENDVRLLRQFAAWR